MRKRYELFRVETILFIRNIFGFFFTFIFPMLMLLLFGSIYGNAPSPSLGGLGMIDVSVPAYSAMIVGVTGLMAFPLTLAAYKEKKIYKRFDASPVGKGAVIGVQALVHFVMTILGFLLLLLVGRLAYGMHMRGSWLVIGLALLLSIASIFSIGFLFTAIAPTIQINHLLCYVSYFVMIFLSGSTIPRQLFPDEVKKVSLLLPLTHAVNVLQGAFNGEAFSQYRSSALVLLVIGLVCGAAGSMLYKRRS